jgi:hypothetical protein
MRMNRGTIVLLVVSILVIAAVVVLNNRQANAPADITPTPTAEGKVGPVFPALADAAKQADLVRLEINNNTDSSKTVLTKDDKGDWTIADATNKSSLATDQTKASSAVNALATLSSVDSLTLTADQKLADFGLEKSQYTLSLSAKDNTTYTVQIGNKATSPRYFGLVNDDKQTVYYFQKDVIDNLISAITVPPYVASPTPTETFTATPNPYSEVQQTATAAVQQTMTAQATPELTSEATVEGTAEVTPTLTPSP